MAPCLEKGIAAARRDGVIEACAIGMGNDKQDPVVHLRVIVQHRDAKM